METISRTKIADLFKNKPFGTQVNVKGWVRTRRGNKQVGFIALNDGSTIKNMQIVIDLQKFDEELLKPITTGACINVNGLLVESQGKGQDAEIQAEEIEIYGTADPLTYPLQKKGHSMEFLREIAHLRPHTNTLELYFGCDTTWQWQYIHFSMKEVFTIFILRSLPHPTVKEQDRCFR